MSELAGRSPRRRRPNKLAESLAEQLAATLPTAERLSFLEWSALVPEPKTGALDFERFPFQREWYESAEVAEQVVIKKAAQVGVSAYAIRWAVYWADIAGLNSLYVFPKKAQLSDFSDARVRRLIDASAHLKSRVPPDGVRNKLQKEIGRGRVYFRGSDTLDDLDAIDADALALDEYDRQTPAHIPDAERRLNASSLKHVRRFGTPTVPGYGISQLYELSDQRVWHVRCGSCGDRQPVTWENVDVDAARRICRRCRKPLDLSSGEWVATHPERDLRGYHVSQLMAPDADLPLLIARSKQPEAFNRQAFYNKDLGLEWAPEEGRLSLAALRAAQRDYSTVDTYIGNGMVTAGVDVASSRPLNVRISEHHDDGTKTALFIGEVQDFEELATLMDRYQISMMVIDHMPERRDALRLARLFPGRVYLLRFGSPAQKDLLEVDDEQGFVTLRRTDLYDATLEQIRRQNNLLPLNLPPGYLEHLQAPIRYADLNARAEPITKYVSTGPDDYAQAEAYDVVAHHLALREVNLASLRSVEYVDLNEEEDLEFVRPRWADDPELRLEMVLRARGELL